MAAIPLELCVGARELTEPRLSPDGARLGWVESAQGVTRLLVQSPVGGDVSVLAEAPVPRAGRGLGGGCWCWTPGGDAIVYAAVDGNLWETSPHASPHASPRRLTDLDSRVAQAPTVAPDGETVVFVVDQAEVWAIARHGSELRRLDDGSADFCFDPAVGDDGTVVWQAWNVPDMPWDGARLQRTTLAPGARVVDVRARGALQQPRPSTDGQILSIRDDSGWANVWRGEHPLVDEPYEHAGPTWGLGQRSYALSPDAQRVAFTRNERGFGRLCVVDLATGAVDDVARGVHGQLSWQGRTLAALRTGARTPTQVVAYDVDADFARRVVDVGPSAEWSAFELVEPELVDVPAGDGAAIPARLYRAGAGDERLICWIHGGPTDQWQVTFLPRIAYWCSRGWNVLVPDHRGSTGHGRAFQQALRGRWGELDVADIVATLATAHARGWGRPEGTVLMGGSAGGFTVLSTLAVAERPAVAAAVVSYPVTDLADLAERSHRFERHYTQTLVDPERFGERSPVGFAHRITTPLLVFHGADDPVVPLAQSRILVNRMRAAGADVELVVYPGEGHGFRNRDNQIDEYRRTESFLARHSPAEGDPIASRG